MSNGIRFSEVSKSFRGTPALTELTFDATKGRVTGLLGRNGAGKTTALKILGQLSRPDSGETTIDGLRLSSHPLGSVGFAMGAGFTPTRSVRDQLMVAGFAFGVGQGQVDDAIERLELTNVARKPCSTLSMGMKQRLNLACAIVAEPHTLILDEPTNGLDPEGIAWLHEFLQAQSKEGVTVLVSSHILHDLEQYVDDVVIMHRRVLWSGNWALDRPHGLNLSDFFQQVTREIEVA
jgi:ABC-2 type transport system ATP-binding protein